MSRSGRTRVAIVDQHAIFTECLEVVLNIHGYEPRVIAMPGRPGVAALLPSVLAAGANVVLINADPAAAGSDGLDLIEPVARSSASVVAITESDDRGHWGACLQRGARIVVPKSASLNSLVSVVRRISEGLPVLSREEREHLVRTHREESSQMRATRHKLHRLTPHEGEILGHLMAGRTVREVASIRFVSEATVRTQVKSILHKLETTSQLAAVAAAHQAQWRSPLQMVS